ncbi:MAG: glycosyltransferase family 2 protein [Planctomycetota bacterium]
MSSTLILIPAHNEAGRIHRVIEGVRGSHPRADVVVVDDGSTDETGEEARARGARVLRHPFNLGYGASLLTGYVYAKQRGYRRVVQLDGDGQHDPSGISKLLGALDSGADVAVGSRYLAGRSPATSFGRRLGSRLFSWIVTRWTGTRITDPTSGYQAMTATAIAELAHAGFPEDYPDADVLITLSRAGLSLTEVSVDMRERSGGVSMHRGGRAAYYAYKMLLTLSLLPVRRRSPYRAERPSSPARAG